MSASLEGKPQSAVQKRFQEPLDNPGVLNSPINSSQTPWIVSIVEYLGFLLLVSNNSLMLKRESLVGNATYYDPLLFYKGVWITLLEEGSFLDPPELK
jgi:hypothetical protein